MLMSKSEVTNPIKSKAEELDSCPAFEEFDVQWLLEELDRVWFHDNALAFHVGDWVRSLHRSVSWPIEGFHLDLAVKKKNPFPFGDVGELLLPTSQIGDQSVEMGSIRPLRETGKVFSTGDLPARLMKPISAKNLHDQQSLEDESSEATIGGSISPDCVSEQGADDLLAEAEVRRLETIPSASALIPFTTISTTAATTPPLPRRSRRKQRRKHFTRSLSELEFDELRGFRDLGFKFTKEDLITPRVVSLVPSHGFTASSKLLLHEEEQEEQKKKGGGGGGGDKNMTSSSDCNRDLENAKPAKVYRERIYPSHAWSIRRPDSPLLNLRMPDPNGEGVDMKAHLKFWARAVASTVRQEC